MVANIVSRGILSSLTENIMSKDYYSTLGVSKGASAAEIKKAYRALAHKYHPDKAGGDEAKFKEVSEAYQVLSDEQKRAQYDQFGSAFGSGGAGGQGFGGFDFRNANFNDFARSGGQGFQGGFDDIFSEFFGGMNGMGGMNGSGEASAQAQKGHDVQVDMELTFEEMARGTKKTFEVYKRVKCSVCSGSGGEPGSKEEVCQTCKGSGRIKRHVRTILGTIAQVEVCGTCSGRGRTFSKKCAHCGGDGRVRENDPVTVDIPSGVHGGQAISISGKGEAGQFGAPAGTLYVVVHVLPQDRYERKGDNVITEEHITIAQACLGDKISVRTIDGEKIIKIPAGTQSHQLFRIKNEGIRSLQGVFGHHLVRVIVDIPKKLTGKQKECIRSMFS